MGIGPITAGGSSFDPEAVFLYDTLGLARGGDGSEVAVTVENGPNFDFSEPEEVLGWENPQGWWDAETPTVITVPAGLYSIDALVGVLVEAGEVEVGFTVTPVADEDEQLNIRWIPVVEGASPAGSHNAVYYYAEPMNIRYVLYPSDEESTIYTRIRLDVRKIG